VTRRNQSIHEYVQEIKGYADSLSSIHAPMVDDDLVALTLHGLGQEYKSFDTSISVRVGGMLDFNELV